MNIFPVAVEERFNTLREFFKLESAAGLMLMAAAVLAIFCANSPLSEYYNMLLSARLTITLNDFGLDKPLLLWINDGLMAVFFLLVGMEIKREILEGELSSRDQAILPVIAALGGVIFPAIIYTYVNQGDEAAISGWAIPAATDIAFALGILALFGKRVPLSLKIFLTAVAVIDDLAAIVIIAIFYTASMSFEALAIAMLCFAFLLLLNLRKSIRTSAYIFIGFVMWMAVLKSGVHATLAGVVLGLLIPHKIKTRHGHSMLTSLEHDLHPWVAFMVLPIFAFANAGLDFSGLSVDDIFHPIPLGIAVGLFIGKQSGIMLFSFLLIKSGLAKLPTGANWRQLYAISILCGVGFTMSLFIGSLAFENSGAEPYTRLGVLIGSLISGLIASIALHVTLPKTAASEVLSPSHPPAIGADARAHQADTSTAHSDEYL